MLGNITIEGENRDIPKKPMFVVCNYVKRQHGYLKSDVKPTDPETSEV